MPVYISLFQLHPVDSMGLPDSHCDGRGGVCGEGCGGKGFQRTLFHDCNVLFCGDHLETHGLAQVIEARWRRALKAARRTLMNGV